MERRYIIFMVLVVLILGGHFGLKLWLAPPGNQQPVAGKQDNAKKEPEKGAQEKKQDEAAKPDEQQGKAAAAEKRPDVEPAPPAVGAPAAKQKLPRKRVMLGSIDPASGYRMLVTLDTQGAAVTCVELAGEADHRYYDIDSTSGYLGHLAEESVDEGLLVHAVGRGTPAYLAKEKTGAVSGGLAAGDVLAAIDGVTLANSADLARELAKTKPGQTVELTVTRKLGGKPTKLTFTARLTRQPLELIKQEQRRHDDGSEEVDPASFLLTLERVGERILRSGEQEIAQLSLRSDNWELTKSTPDEAEFTYTLDEATLGKIGQKGPIRIVKRFTLAKVAEANSPPGPGYSLRLRIEIHNDAQETQEIAYVLSGPNGLPLEGWWYTTKLHPEMWKTAGARDVVWRQPGAVQKLKGCAALYGTAVKAQNEKKPFEELLLTGNNPEPLEYVGVDTQFFAAMMKPLAGETGLPRFKKANADILQDVSKLKKERARTTNVSIRLVNEPVRLAGGGELAHEYEVFLGPKDRKVLEFYTLDHLIETGWRVFAVPAWILGGILEGIYSAAKNYGIAIILLTVIVRSCMLPLSIRQAKSAAKMQELAPEMQRIKEKFADDMEKQGQAMRELYAKHNFNPFGGCLLVFIQLPIFIGLYRCLSIDINLRDAALIPGLQWASNLAGPDRLFYWKDWLWSAIADETGWLGPYCNVLPVITCVLFIIQQKLFTPPATDEQTEMQQKMMMYMTVFMGVMFFKVPAGLCIYFITSSLWSIVERKLLPKHKPAGGDGGPGTKALATKPSPNGSPTDKRGPKAKRK